MPFPSKASKGVVYMLADRVPKSQLKALGVKDAKNVRAVYTGQKRKPKKGEWYLSGARVSAYMAPNDLDTEFHIARLVLKEFDALGSPTGKVLDPKTKRVVAYQGKKRVAVIARRVAAEETDWEDPKLLEAMEVMEAAETKLVQWLNAKTRVSWKGYVGKSSNLYEGLNADLDLSAREDRQRGGGFWSVNVRAKTDGTVVVETRMPQDSRSIKGHGNLDWNDLKNPEKIFEEARIKSVMIGYKPPPLPGTRRRRRRRTT